MRILKKISLNMVLMLMLLSLSTGMMFIVGSAEETGVSVEKQYNFDVVFVVDGSGSMLGADPSKLTAQAVGQFIGMLDDSCRAGYVVYSHKLVSEHELVNVKDKKEIDSLQKKIEDVDYKSDADTDISLGLTEAMHILERANVSVDRKPMIVLLSDGNTDLPKGPRTVEESKKEQKSTLESLKNSGVRVYTIGLNSDGSLDKSEMENIAKSTGAKSFEAKSADELSGIVKVIFADYDGIDPIPVQVETDKDANLSDSDAVGYVATIPIENSSVYLANIVINNSNGVSNPQLFNPGGFKVTLDEDSQVKVRQGRTYMVIKIYSPEVGEWKLKIQGVKDDDIEITLLESYSFYVDQKVDAKTVTENSDVKVTASLCGKDGVITDSDLLSTVKAECSVKDGNGEPQKINLEHDGKGIFTGTYHIDNKGTYSFQTTIKANDESFEKTSKSLSISAEDIWSGLKVEQSVSADTLEAGESIDIEASLFNGEKALTDELQLANYTVKAIVTDDGKDPVAEIPMTLDEKGVYRGNYVFQQEGIYKIVTSVTDNATNENRNGNLDTVHATKPSLKLISNTDQISMHLVSPPHAESDNIMLSHYAVWAKGEIVSIEMFPGSSEFFDVSVNTLPDDFEILVTGKKGGYGSFDLNCTDKEGNTIQLKVSVTVENGWKPFITAAVIILIAGAAIFLIFIAVRPKLKRMGISVSIIVPNDVNVSNPAKQDVALPSKHSSTLWQILKDPKNSFAYDSLKEAVNAMGLGGDLKRIKVVAKGKHKMDIVVTGSESNPYVVNGVEVIGKESTALEQGDSQKFDLLCSDNGHLVIKYME